MRTLRSEVEDLARAGRCGDGDQAGRQRHRPAARRRRAGHAASLASAVVRAVPARFTEGGLIGDALRAEHGFSCLVEVERDGRAVRVLFDAGLTPDGLVENMRRLEIAPGDIDIVVLSHGHWDHTTGMDGLVRAPGRANVPALIHPEFGAAGASPSPGAERSRCL